MNSTQFSVAGKSVLVTGAGKGIGRATALLLTDLGASVLAVSRDGRDASSLTNESVGMPGRLLFMEVDVRQQEQIDAAIAFAERQFGALHGIVNNAAVCNTGKRIEDLSDTEWDTTFDINLKGIFRTCRSGLPVLRRSGGGSVINVSSVHALATARGHADYAASKGAVLALSRQLALDYAIDRIRVNALIVGSVDTRMSQPAFAAAGSAEALGLSFNLDAIPRIGTPQEIASVIAFLLSDAASFINGNGLIADGGLLAKLL